MPLPLKLGGLLQALNQFVVQSAYPKDAEAKRITGLLPDNPLLALPAAANDPRSPGRRGVTLQSARPNLCSSRPADE